MAPPKTHGAHSFWGSGAHIRGRACGHRADYREGLKADKSDSTHLVVDQRELIRVTVDPRAKLCVPTLSDR